MPLTAHRIRWVIPASGGERDDRIALHSSVRLAVFGNVIAVDLDDQKLALARSMGADHTLNAKGCDVPAEVYRLTDGRGADAALEVVGAAKTVQSAIMSVRRGGAVTLVGNLSPTVEVPLQPIVNRELTLLGSCASNGEIPQCIEYLRRGLIDVRPMITATARLEEGPQWFDRLYAGEPGAMKVILQPT